MTAVLEADGLAKRYGRRWALRNCTLTIPEGRVVGLVGPNGAGKTTLLHLAVGLLAPTAGRIAVLGGRPGDGPAQLARVGFVAQSTPVYSGLSVANHVRMGAWLNPNWDAVSQEVIEESHTDRQTTLLVRTDEPILDPAWTVKPVVLEDLVLAYMSQARDADGRRPRLGVLR